MATVQPSDPDGRPARAPGDEAPAGTPGTGEVPCPDCAGKGTLAGRPCPRCAGTGSIVRGVGGA